jgi:oligopeptidase A
MTAPNPLLDSVGLPKFNEIKVSHIRPAVDAVLSSNRENIKVLETMTQMPDWISFVQPLEDLEDYLSRVWSPISHLNSVADNEELRIVYEDCIALLSAYYTEVGQNKRLFEKFTKIKNDAGFSKLKKEQQKVVDNNIRDFRLSGVDLDDDSKVRFAEISEQISSLSNIFSKNVLDCTDKWSMIISNAADLSGLPESAMAMAAQEAKNVGESGWRFTLKAPSLIPFLTYAENRDLRKKLYKAYVTRASELGPHCKDYDNSSIIEDILRLRAEQAELLGFENYAEYSLQAKMAKDVTQVEKFLFDLAERARGAALEELEELKQFAKINGHAGDLEAWDLSFYSEKLKQNKFDLSDEQLRPWFPLPTVLNGLFSVVSRLFSITVRPCENVQVWHPDVQTFELLDSGGEIRGQFFVDLYAREKKRGGAWMADCVSRRRVSDSVQIPVAFLVCNFTPPVGDKPALLTHDEVLTLFHEFGHGLHHMLTKVDYVSISGINGVEWDAVELPSQFLENWCWEADALEMFSGHYKSGEVLPVEMLDKMKAGKNYHAAMQMLRQVEFSLFDLSLHSGYPSIPGETAMTVLQRIRREVSVVEAPEFNRFPHSFGHIFSGGYAAGYYSYKWAEVLSADAFSKFEETGIFNQDTGNSFLSCILEKGGSDSAMNLFTEFRGREPDASALFRHCGLSA